MVEKTCIVCGKPIKKRMRSLSFIPATANGRLNGFRENRTVYLDKEYRPKSKEGAQRYTNHPILRAPTDSHGLVYEITWWEGEYEDDHFHSQTCAAKFGRRMAREGYR